MGIKLDQTRSLIFKANIAFKTSDFQIIKGQVTEKLAPIPCRVRLFERKSGLLMSEVLTDEQGYYQFGNLSDLCSYFLIAHHPKLQFNAIIQDNVVPK